MLYRTLQNLDYASTVGHAMRRAIADDAQADAAVAAVIDSIVAADRFDVSALAAFMDRDSYPRAVRALQNMVPPRFRESLARCLYHADDNPFHATRIARHFEVLPDAKSIELSDLQALVAADDYRAVLALAALKLVGWSEADRACRAIITLRALTRAWQRS